jgi:hypothetical protein
MLRIWRTPVTIVERLTSQLRPAMNGCLEYIGSRSTKGYGRIRIEGRYLAAHRVAYEAMVGPIPDGLWVLHRCDNPPCCNPKHLWIGTAEDNNRDRDLKGRHRHGTQPRRLRVTGKRGPYTWSAGTRAKWFDANRRHTAKLTAAQVAEMRTRRGSEGLSHEKLAKLFGVSKSQARDICNHKYWKEIA